MSCHQDSRQSFLIRLWAEDDRDDDAALRGFIQDVRTGHKTYFNSLDFPVGLLRETARRIGSAHQRLPLR